MDSAWILAVAPAAALAMLAVKRLWPGLLRRGRRGASVWVLAAAAALGAQAAPGAPTGYALGDGLWRGAFAVLVVVACTRARRWAWLTASAVVLLAAAGSAYDALAAAALGVSLGAAVGDRRSRGIGALVGACLSQSLLHLRYPQPWGLTSGVAAAVVVSLVVSHLRVRRRTIRHRAGLAGTALLVAGGLASAGFVHAVLTSRASVAEGVSRADAALADARSGRAGRAGAELASARADFTSTARSLNSWWARPAELVPVVGHYYRAATTLAEQGVTLAGGGWTLARSINSAALRPQGATIDLGALGALGRPVASTSSILAGARAAIIGTRSPWLVPAVRAELDGLVARISALSRSEETLALALRVLPHLAGAGAPQRWFVAILDNSELRGAGGLMADYAEIDSQAGHFRLTSLRPLADLAVPPGGAKITGPSDYLARYGGFDPGEFPGDVFYSPDFPTDAAVVQQAVPQWGAQPVDGVVGIDAYGVAALLKLTGPVIDPYWSVPLSSSNTAAVLLHDQYLVLSPSTVDLFDTDLGRRVYQRLQAMAWPDPAALADVLGPVVRAGHLALWSDSPQDERLFEAIGASGRLPSSSADFLEVVTQNASEDKADWYLRRSVGYQAVYQPADGATSAQASITLTNLEPSSGLPAYVIGSGSGPERPGYLLTWVSVYSALELQSATLDGRPFVMRQQTEAGHFVSSGWVTLAPGGSSHLVVRLAGSIPASPSYHLVIGRQAAPSSDSVAVSVRGSGGAWVGTPGGGDPATGKVQLSLQTNTELTFRPSR